jgi:hypothetical protein
MHRPKRQPSTDTVDDRPVDTSHAADEADAARIARLRRDRALTPSQRLDKLAALCRQADLLRGARRLP